MTVTELAIAFDTTGNLYSLTQYFKEELMNFVDYFESHNLNLSRFGLICGFNEKPFVLRLTPQLLKAKNHLDKTYRTKSASPPSRDFPSVLTAVRKELRWQRDANKILILVTDGVPFYSGMADNNFAWRKELKKLVEKDVKVYTIQYGNEREGTWCLSEIADRTKGFAFRLSRYDDFIPFLHMFFYSLIERISVKSYIFEDYSYEVENNIKKFKKLGGLKKLPINNVGENYQILHVDKYGTIKSFMSDHKLLKPYKTYYQIDNTTKIHPFKEVLYFNTRSGELLENYNTRRFLNIPLDIEVNYTPSPSLTFNREVVLYEASTNSQKLMPGTKFIWQLSNTRAEMDEDSPLT